MCLSLAAPLRVFRAWHEDTSQDLKRTCAEEVRGDV